MNPKMPSPTQKRFNKSTDMLEIAQELAGLIKQETNRVTKGDKRDFWILNNPEEAAAKVSKEEQKAIAEDGSPTRAEVQRAINKLTRERVTEEGN